MAIGVDTSKWKPRNLRGTPAAKIGNIISLGLIAFGTVSGLIFHFAAPTKNLRKATDALLEDPIEEVERKLLIASGIPVRTGDQIRQMLKEEDRPDLPYK